LTKTFITAIIVVSVSELSKRYTIWAALLASLPLTSILAFIWLYVDTKDTNKIAELSYSIFWLVLPSLAFFLILPGLLKYGVDFTVAMGISILLTALIYATAIWVTKIIA